MKYLRFFLSLVLILCINLTACSKKQEASPLGIDLSSLILTDADQALETISKEADFTQSTVQSDTYIFQEDFAGRTWYTMFQTYEGSFVNFRKYCFFTEEEKDDTRIEMAVKIYDALVKQYGEPNYHNVYNEGAEDISYPISYPFCEEWKTDQAYVRYSSGGLSVLMLFPDLDIEEGAKYLYLEYQQPSVYDEIHR